MNCDFFVGFKYRKESNSYNRMRLTASTVTQTRPTSTSNIDFVVKFSVEVPDEFLTPEIKVKLEAPSVQMKQVVDNLQKTVKDLS